MAGNKRPWTIETKKLISLSSLGLMLPSSIAVGLLFGYLLDKAFGTQPWLLIAFFALGTASGIINLLRGIDRLEKKEKEDIKREK